MRIEWKQILAFGLTMLGSACLNNIFATYYIELFCYVLDISGWWFFMAQMIFMIWNTLNDPLFGWISDNLASAKKDPLQQRTNAIRYGGTIWAVAFVTVWFPPSSSSSPATQGLYFAFCLCFYDGLLTFVEVNHSALLNEISFSATDRARCNLASAGFATVGSLSSFLGHSVWDREDLSAFRRLSIVLAAVATIAFHVSAMGLMDRPAASRSHGKSHQGLVAKHGRQSQALPPLGAGREKGAKGRSDGEKEGMRLSFKELVQELARSRNMVIYCVVNFLQCFDCTFEKNFFPIFLAQFAAGRLSQQTRAAIVASSFVLPWIATSGYTAAVQTHGLYATLKAVFNMRIVVAAAVILLAPTNWPEVACGLLLLNRVLSESVCRLGPLIVSDLIDEDSFVHKRQQTVAATIVGTAGTMGKVSQSLAPMVGYWLIPPTAATLGDGGTAAATYAINGNAAQRRQYLGRVIVCVVVCVVGTQRYLWHRFTLRDKYLKRVKVALQRGTKEDYSIVV